MRCALAVLLVVIGTATAEARTVVERAQRGDTRAELSYDRRGDGVNATYRDFRLRIYEVDAIVVNTPLANCGTRCRRYAPARFGRRDSIRVRDLNGGAPEVLVDFYTGGAYCCWLTVAYRAKGESYTGTAQTWGPKRPRLTNVGGGRPEFISFDDSFLGPYGCAACWRYLPHVWRFGEDGKFRDVTRRFPDRVRPSSKALRRKYFRASDRGGDVKPWLAAYVATTYLLERPRAGWRLVRRALRRGELDERRGRYDFCPCGSAYPDALRRHLRRYDYL